MAFSRRRAKATETTTPAPVEAPKASPATQEAPNRVARPQNRLRGAPKAAPAPATPADEKPAQAPAGPAAAPSAGGGLDRVVSTVFKLAPWDQAERLMVELTLDDPTQRSQIDRSLNRAEKNALEAHRLKIAAEVEFEALKVDGEKALADLRDRAQKELSDEKAQGNRPKAITDADVTARMAQLDAELFRAEKRRELERTKTCRHLGHLADLWKQRAWTLAAMKQ